jgi:hypothetical protein
MNGLNIIFFVLVLVNSYLWLFFIFHQEVEIGPYKAEATTGAWGPPPSFNLKIYAQDIYVYSYIAIVPSAHQ